MSIANQRKYCKELGGHLRYVGGKLVELGIVRDISPIHTAASQYVSTLNTSLETFAAVLANLVFTKVDPDYKFRKTRPSSFDVETGLELTVDVDLTGNIPNGEIKDPFCNLEVNFKLIGLNGQAEALVNSWHIDRHILKKDGENEEAYFPHPLYHIQYGGRKMTEDENLNHGNILLVEAPRISFPPVDVLLVIDFVLANYYGKVWYDLKEDLRYNDAVKFSRDNIWRPYYRSISDILSPERIENEGFSHVLINPHLRE